MYNVIIHSMIVSASYMAEGGPVSLTEALEIAHEVFRTSPGQYRCQIVAAA